MTWFTEKNNTLYWSKEACEELETIQFVLLPKVGDLFHKGDVFLEVEASKATYEIEAPFDLKVEDVYDGVDAIARITKI